MVNVISMVTTKKKNVNVLLPKDQWNTKNNNEETRDKRDQKTCRKQIAK